MTCDNARPQLSAWVDGDLAPAARAALGSHLSTCEACTQALDRLQRTVSLLHGLATPQAPAGFAGRVLAAAREPAAELAEVAVTSPALAAASSSRVKRVPRRRVTLQWFMWPAVAALVAVTVYVEWPVRDRSPVERLSRAASKSPAPQVPTASRGETYVARGDGEQSPRLPRAVPRSKSPRETAPSVSGLPAPGDSASDSRSEATTPPAPLLPSVPSAPSLPAASPPTVSPVPLPRAPSPLATVKASPPLVAVPTIAGRLVVTDPEAAEQALRDLVGRLGGTTPARSGTTTLASDDRGVEAVLPPGSYEAFVTEAARLGRWEAGQAPETRGRFRIELRVTR